MSDKQQKSIKTLKKKISEEKLVCYKTDKTGNLALDTIESYSKKMTKHIKDDEVIAEKMVKTIENSLSQKEQSSHKSVSGDYGTQRCN